MKQELIKLREQKLEEQNEREDKRKKDLKENIEVNLLYNNILILIVVCNGKSRNK